jgi:putative tricarboxylic transport membrane protein
VNAPDRTAGALLFAFAAFVVVQALRLPYWIQSAPGPGFVPLWLGLALAAAAVALIATGAVRQAASTADRAQARRVTAVTALASVSALLVYPLGMVLASGIFVGAVLFYLAPARRAGNAFAAALTPPIVWLVFVRWLAVPLPRGPLGF